MKKIILGLLLGLFGACTVNAQQYYKVIVDTTAKEAHMYLVGDMRMGPSTGTAYVYISSAGATLTNIKLSSTSVSGVPYATLNENTFILNADGIGIGVGETGNIGNSIGIGTQIFGGNNSFEGIGIGYLSGSNSNSSIGIGPFASFNTFNSIGMGYGNGYNTGSSIGIGYDGGNNSGGSINIGGIGGNTSGGISIGVLSDAMSSGVAVGPWSCACGVNSVALGAGATVEVNNAIQIGTGINNIPNSTNFAYPLYGDGSHLTGILSQPTTAWFVWQTASTDASSGYQNGFISPSTFYMIDIRANIDAVQADGDIILNITSYRTGNNILMGNLQIPTGKTDSSVILSTWAVSQDDGLKFYIVSNTATVKSPYVSYSIRNWKFRNQ